MDSQQTLELINYLETFVVEKRLERFKEVLSRRTDHLRIVLENIYQAHNASAVLRSCDAFGIQHVHFIENRNAMRISDEVAMGSSKWLTIHRHREPINNTLKTIQELKSQGYRIVATSPHKNDTTIDKLPVEGKIALFFGTELDGISQELKDNADEFVKIPMLGFTESFNISVCAALCMFELNRRIRNEVPNHLLTEEEKQEVYLQWLKSSIDKSDLIVEKFLNEKKG